MSTGHSCRPFRVSPTQVLSFTGMTSQANLLGNWLCSITVASSHDACIDALQKPQMREKDLAMKRAAWMSQKRQRARTKPVRLHEQKLLQQLSRPQVNLSCSRLALWHQKYPEKTAVEARFCTSRTLRRLPKHIQNARHTLTCEPSSCKWPKP